MSIYRELDPLAEHRTQRALRDNTEYKTQVNIPNLAYPNQHVDIKRLSGSIEHFIVPDTIKITFNLDIESTDKTRSIVNNVGRALVKTDTINNADIYNNY